MTVTVDFSKDERHLAIVANVERLLADAKLLVEKGSPGTALATAILAFEESGKGERLSLGLDKPRGKGSPSWHVFRQEIASFSLFASLFQKYGLSLPTLDATTRQHFEERGSGNNSLEELLEKPVPPEMRSMFADQLMPGIDRLSDDDRLLLRIESRWVNKVFLAAASGKVEMERQSGLYVDVEDQHVTSDPEERTKLRALYWIVVAERSFDILRDGAFHKPYGPLAAYVETLPRPLPSWENLAVQVRKIGEL